MSFHIPLLLLLSLPLLTHSWDYSHREYETEQIPIHTIISETKTSGHYDHGNEMYLKAVVFEMGGCSSGHPCALGSGLSWLYPDGCPLSQCFDRWNGDPWESYTWKCPDHITSSSQSTLNLVHQNNTRLSTEWWTYNDNSCLLTPGSAPSEYVHEDSGVAIVVKTQGFTFPPQTVHVLDIDSVNSVDGAAMWPDVPQEVSTNFAILDNMIIKPSNSYSSSHLTAAQLALSTSTVSEVKVTLKQSLLDHLDLGISEDDVMASAAGLTLSKVEDAPEMSYPDWQVFIAGSMVWATFSSPFDTMVYTMTLARKTPMDPDQALNLHPLTVRKRCRCSAETKPTVVIRPTSTEFICTSHLVDTTSYTCDETGIYYCNIATITAWDRSAPELPDGTIPCTPRNTTKTLFETTVSNQPALFTWPSTQTSIPFPSPSPQT